MVTKAAIRMLLTGLAASAAWAPAAALPDVHLNSTCDGLGFEGTAHEKGKMIHFMSCPGGTDSPGGMPATCHARIWTPDGRELSEARLEARGAGEEVVLEVSMPVEEQLESESPEAEVARCLGAALERMGMDPDSPSMRCFRLQIHADEMRTKPGSCE